MKIIQLMPTLSYGDAVGNDVLAINTLLHNLGIETKIYAIDIDIRIPVGAAESFYKIPNMEQDDIVIYHLSIGCKSIRNYLIEQDCRKVMIYHNITPVYFFNSYRDEYQYTIEKVLEGFEDLQILKDTFEACIADSEFNKQDLITLGYTCPIEVLPILVPFADYEQEPDSKILSQYANDGWKNILFVGRIAPNKCQEDVILSFATYKNLYNEKSRLFIVGNYNEMGSYYNRLQKYVEELGVADVIFTGHIPFKSILSYYHLADAFLCMSEHEGFCVPLLEAMKFDIPIVAYSSTAIPYTLGEAGVVFPEKDPNLVAAILDEVICDKGLRERLLVGQRKRLEYFKYDNVADLARQIFTQLINHEKIKTAEITGEGCVSIFEQLLPKLKEKAANKKMARIKPFSIIPVEPPKTKIVEEGTRFSFVRMYYNQICSQTGIKAFIKRKLFGNLLHVLMEQEKLLSEMEKRLAEMEETLASQHTPFLRDKPGLLIDVSYITKNDLGTGIQRVVNNIFGEINKYKKDRNVIAVCVNRGGLSTSYRFTNRFDDVKERHNYAVSLEKGDKFLLLDSSWEFHNDFLNVLEAVDKVGAHSFAVIYDMFPIQYPKLFDSIPFVSFFKNWHNMILKKADAVICISQTTADVVIQYYKNANIKRDRPLNVFYFHMGAEIPAGNMFARESICRFVKRKTTFLMVGTLEPRKGHMIALQAFVKLVKDYKQDCQLLIIGHDGWKNDEIRQKLKLPELKDAVLWIQDASDEELRWAYANSSALIAASKDEGFGLPLVEAAHFGLPIICSDIPIFREVTQGNADYFKAMDADNLARCISEWLEAKVHPDSGKIRIYTWQEAAQEILDIIDGKVEPYKVL